MGWQVNTALEAVTYLEGQESMKTGHMRLVRGVGIAGVWGVGTAGVWSEEGMFLWSNDEARVGMWS